MPYTFPPKQSGRSPPSFHQVREETERERQSALRSQAGGLATQMAAIHYHKAEKRTRVLETSRAMLTLQSQLTRQLRQRRSLEKGEMAQSIHHHCSVGHGFLLLFLRLTDCVTSYLRHDNTERGGRGRKIKCGSFEVVMKLIDVVVGMVLEPEKIVCEAVSCKTLFGRFNVLFCFVLGIQCLTKLGLM